MKRAILLPIVAVLALGAATAQARPLTLAELYDFGQYLACIEQCGKVGPKSTYQQIVNHYECLADKCVKPPYLWEKNGIPPVDGTDHWLALLEYQDSQNPAKQLICYADADKTIVIPGALCAGDVCLQMPECSEEQCALPQTAEIKCEETPNTGKVCWWPAGIRPAACPDPVCAYSPAHTPDDCADSDSDGLPAWLEDYLGLDPWKSDFLCNGATPCAFEQQCVFNPDYGTGLCQPRECPPSGCTAFHLELVAQDDVQAIVHVHYDWTPVPARVLDLYLDYDGTSLVLEDSRALVPLVAMGKQLNTTHLADGTLRLTVLDLGASYPIPTGPIIELVFRRVGDGATTVSFATEDQLQVKSVAPFQGTDQVQDELADDSLWGAAINLAPRDEIATKMLLWYAFQSTTSPLDYANIPSAEKLCSLLANCANEPDQQQKDRLIARLAMLQAGELYAAETVAGVIMNGLYLNGTSDHMRLPVNFEQPLAAGAQSFSWSTWFYAEGPSSNEKASTPQLLFTHNSFDERTRFGLKLITDGNATATVTLFDGDFLAKWGTVETPIVTGVPLLTWHHLGFALDAATGEIFFYFDGLPVTAKPDGTPLPTYKFSQPPMAIACPQFHAGKEIKLHEEGDVLGGRPPEFIYYGVKRSGLHKIERTDPSGQQTVTVIGSSSANFRDPDYSPVVDRIVYSSNITGDYEIWIAAGDGSNPRQLTNGFGDSYRQIKARRPRWAPDATGIVFESSMYDVLSYDNVFAQVKHLYYIGYDPKANEVAIELANGDIAQQLDYETLVANQSIEDYRLTSGVLDRHHSRATFLEGRDKAAGTLGTILLQSAGLNNDQKRIEWLTIDEILPLNSFGEELPDLGEPGEEIRLLAAHYSAKATAEGPIVSKYLFYERSYIEYVGHDQYVLQWQTWHAPSKPGGEPEGYVASIIHQPTGYGDKCWDANFDDVPQADEDRNGDGLWNKEDCYPHAESNLYLVYDDDNLVLDKAGSMLTPAVADLDKSLAADPVVAFEVPYIRIRISSPLSAAPIPVGKVATILFLVKPPAEEPVATDLFDLHQRLNPSELLLKNLEQPGLWPMNFEVAGRFDILQEATFSPDGDRLLLSAISNAQPVLLASASLNLADPKSLKSAAGAVRVDQESMTVRSMDWVRQTRYYACGWIGGYQHLAEKTINSAFRGGLDELKVFSGLRHHMAFRSEAERGIAVLKKAGQDGSLGSKLPGCGNSNMECPPYHLCVESECIMVPCDPTDPWACVEWGGRCTLRPKGVEQEYGTTPEAFAFVCAAECNTDQQCLLKQCANGPCRFCDTATQTCIECRDTTKTLGALTIAVVEGCPDEKSFSCQAGTCVSECYLFDDDASSYLCDSALEYCQKGKCVLHDWSWWDLAPATFSGGAGMRRNIPPDYKSGWYGYTQAVDQKIPLTVTAYGVADYLQSPELMVEVRGGPFYGAQWHRVGRIQVHNRTKTQAYGKPYGLYSPYPFIEMRLRMVTTPYRNVTGAASGMGDKDDQFCVDDLTQTALAAGEPVDVSACYQQAQGSRYVNGYEVGVPYQEGAQACAKGKEGPCPVLAKGEHDFLMGGNPAVIVLDVTVDGGGAMNAIVSNPVCTYEGSLVPVDGGITKKTFYGDIATERSNEAEAWCLKNPELCADGSELVEFNIAMYGHALLNCNVYNPGGLSAGLYLSLPPQIHEWPAKSGAIVSDTGDICQVEVSSEVVQPCHAWFGNDVTIDSNNSGTPSNNYTEFQSLEFGLFRNFSHEEGFEQVLLPTAPVEVCLTGYEIGGGLVLGNNGDFLAVDGAVAVDNAPGCAGNLYSFGKKVKLGKGYSVTVKQQPANPELSCLAKKGSGAIAAAPDTNPPVAAAARVEVACGLAALKIGGTVTGATGQVLLAGKLAAADGYPLAAAQVAATDGPFSFGQMMPAAAGDSYVVSLVSAPVGQMCQVAKGSGTATGNVTDIAVTCWTPPSYKLGIKVFGLVGGGLVVQERKSKQNLSCAADSVYQFAMAIQEGQPLDLIVSQQPFGPEQVCAFVPAGAGSVAMPGKALTVDLVCTTIPLYSISGKVVGMMGSGLTISLNTMENKDIPASAIATEKSFLFQTMLKSGESYSVTVLNHPANPVQQCQVGFDSGVVTGANVTDVLVICAVVEQGEEMYSVGGTVTGLKGSGLRLNFKDNQQFLEIGGNGPFNFKNKVPKNFAYKVTIEKQPQNPVQNCFVTNGTGEVGSADVTSVKVDCYSAASLTLSLTGLDPYNGSLVDARLYSLKDKKLVGLWAKGRRIKSGGVVNAMAVPGSEMNVAGMLGGGYMLYVRIDAKGDPDPVTGLPLFDELDLAASKVVNMADGQSSTVALTATHFGPMSPCAVTAAINGTLEPGAKMRCYWALAGLGTVTPSPALGITAPVVAVAIGGCGNNGCQVQTPAGSALAEGKAYDINCWIDNDGSGKVDYGDWTGSKTEVVPKDEIPLDGIKLLGPVEVELKVEN